MQLRAISTRRRPARAGRGYGLLACALAVCTAWTAAEAGGAVIYVDQQIRPSSTRHYDPATRSADGGGDRAFRSLAGAAAEARAGTTVLIRGGTYCQQLKPAHSGAPGRYVTFRNYGNEVVTLAGQSLAPAIDISCRSYIRIEGLRVADVWMWLWCIHADHNVLRNNRFFRPLHRKSGGKVGVYLEYARFNRIVGNVMEDGPSDNLTLVLSDHNLIAANTIRKAAHALWAIRGGSFNVLRGNTFHNELQKIGEVYDCDTADIEHVVRAYNCTRRNLIEANRFARTPPSQIAPYSGIQYAGQDGIIRRNLFYDTAGPGLDLTLYGKEANYTTGNRVYHNVFYGSDWAGLSFAGASGFSFRDNVIVNNILAGSRFVAHDRRWGWHTQVLAGKGVQLLAGRLDGFVFRGNDLYSAGGDGDYLITLGRRSPLDDPQTVAQIQAKYPRLFEGNTTADPLLEAPEQGRFSLRPGSALIDRGQFLTRAAGSGSGTSLPVEDASYFYDGFGIEGEAGDRIQLAGQKQTARIRKVDYEKNLLLLDEALTWKDGQGVALRYAGAAPDVGAMEFLPGGNAPPVASFTAAVAAANPLRVRFDAAGSADTDGKVTAYEWDFGDGQSLRSVEPVAEHTYGSPGTYRAALTVVDDGDEPLSSGAARDAPIGRPALKVSAEALDFGPARTAIALELTNTGTGTLTWRLVGGPKWLLPAQRAGSFTRTGRIEVRVDRRLVGRGAHAGTIRLEAGAAGAAEVSVRMRVPTVRRTALVRVGDTWRYFKGTAAPPAEWNRAGFDDSKWSAGRSGIGVSGRHYGTQLRDMRYNYVTFYARRTFEIADPDQVASVALGLQYDDGFIAYLNGREVARSDSMGPAGSPFAYNARALADHDEGLRAETYPIRMTPGLLSAGRNVLAIEVHNNWLESPDAGVVPRLTASVVVDPETAARNRMLWAAGMGGGGFLLATLAGWGLWTPQRRRKLQPAVRAVAGPAKHVVDWMLVAAAGCAIVAGSLCPPGMIRTRASDKTLHALAYAALTLLLLRAISRNGALVRLLAAMVKAFQRRVGFARMLVVLAVVMVMGTAIEYVQPMFGRDRSIRDIIANMTGGCLAVLAWLIGSALLRRNGKP